MRTSIEVPDIFRTAGPAYRAAHAGHLSLAQLKVMSAIENCRTAALHRIRHYGLLAGSARKASLALARELLDVAAPPDTGGSDEPEDFRPPCPCCGGRMIVIETFERWRQPRGPPHASATKREDAP